jgi:lysosomal acid lipase/cholesteryl ester hydrolase
MSNQKDEMNDHVIKCRDKYFDYSFHEMAIYDQPALWKFVMKETNETKITYIGHSQGTT